ncbi:hypothetical protein [Chryseobacterium sp.]|uniref:hypothetical protein n=1 Tax=Chryseobacterium sp. TaxID=1871047 RepID=UPI003219A04D
MTFIINGTENNFEVVYLSYRTEELRLLISIFIIFTVAVRPVLPLVNYAVNYDYIVKNLCENREVPQSTCKGKCYVEKELAKTEKQSNSSQTIKIAGLDVFLSHDILSFSDKKDTELKGEIPGSHYFDSHSSDYFSRIFHPPLV